MGVIWSIALRNLREHKVKSIIIGSLIALGMFMLVLGNSIIDTGKAGIKKSFIESFSGDIMVGPLGKDGQKPAMLQGGMGGDSAGRDTLPAYTDVYQLVSQTPGVYAVDPQVSGSMQIELNDDWRAVSIFFGVDQQAYAKIFPNNFVIDQGTLIAPDQEGVMLSQKSWQGIKDKSGITLKIGDPVKLVGFSGGAKIKSVPLIGIFHFRFSNIIADNIGFLDLSSLRYMLGMVVGAQSQVTIDSKAQSLLDSGNDSADLDAMFADSNVINTTETTSAALSDKDLNHILGDTSQRAALSRADSGAWHYILMRLNDGVSVEKTIDSLNAQFAQKGWKITAVDWQGAAGFLASLASGIQLIFLIFVIIISVVSVFVIMNTMVVSITERTGEIGTMRALGAQKGYIRRVFLTETLTLSVAGGLIGLVLAVVLIVILNATGIQSPNSFFDLLYGGKVMHPVLSWVSAVQAMVIMLAVGLLSSLYPIAVALRIQPVRAMQQS